jgi:hypothetical protein
LLHRRPALDAVGLGERGDLLFIAADQDRVRHHPVAILQRDTAFAADGGDRADQVLVHAHAPGHGVHHDSEPMCRHYLGPPTKS